ncbi:hypothetical protein DLJ47_29090 [Micromonospora sp. S4605]|uniref:hypothetical protein n=1 Tax=Micromonospora sp. S4605 TaxID=1420897 RepID=UPI000D6EFDA0|nr:hypothetical protein [Micromonospora sp. S4605]PWU48015.1 hypothetical protein DLJ47_29090 [Micromonospora sp. S4605]
MESDEGFTPVFVSYHQFQVGGGAERGDDLGLYTVGDDLLQVTGRSQLTVLTGPHTGHVGVRLTLLGSAPPEDDHHGWQAGAEATVWLPDGRVSVCGLMGDCPPPLRQVEVGGPGLFRVRVESRDRTRKGTLAVPEGPERYQVTIWPVDEDPGFRTLRRDDLPSPAWQPNPARAAGWAMVRLVTLADPDPREVALRRAATGNGETPVHPPADRAVVRRHRTMAVDRATDLLSRPAELLGATVQGDELVLPVGGLEVRLQAVAADGGLVARWRWVPKPGTASPVPDARNSTVEVGVTPASGDGTAGLAVVHRGVPASDAILLGLVWDHLLDRLLETPAGGGGTPHPWEPVLAELATRAAATAARNRRRHLEFEARRWGGAPPSDGLRRVPANTIGLARLDRPFLDALADAAPDVQRAVARWGARQACALAGLTGIGWIARALTALERGEPLPPPFDDDQQAWARLWADDRVPSTTVTTPDGTPNCSQQAIALPAVRAAAHEDPLAGAVDTVYFAALAAGADHREVLAAANVILADLSAAR